MKRALILDLDNTIYPVSSIADDLFRELFRVLDQYSGSINTDDADRINQIKEEMTRRPFHHIADDYGLSEELRSRMTETLKHMSYDLPMKPYEDYQYIRSMPLDKFLVTTGFVKLQLSKVKMLGIENDFKNIHIVDPEVSGATKKDIFIKIMEEHAYNPEELLVIGDDPQSEIKAAKELGVDTFLYDPGNIYPNASATYKSVSLRDVEFALT